MVVGADVVGDVVRGVGGGEVGRWWRRWRWGR
jgi:hypothetical protein